MTEQTHSQNGSARPLHAMPEQNGSARPLHAMPELTSAVKTSIKHMTKEQLDGALFLIATLHDTLKDNWVQEGGGLTTLAIADIFDKLVNICSSLRVTTQRYKSGEWMSGALEIIDVLRIQLRHLEGKPYDKQSLVDALKGLVEYMDDC
jgi:hypothetical protein